MYIDAQQLFSDAQALVATAPSTNIIDLSSDRNIGIGEPMCVAIEVDVAADVADADETYQFDVQTDDNAGFATPTVIASRVVAGALLFAGARVAIGIPADLSAERFLRVNYTLGGTTPSITVTAHLQPQNTLQAEAVYPDGYTIS